MKPLISKVGNAFKEHFGEEYIVVSSPGRVNLIGEHTDYNEGFVLPAAIDKRIIFALRLNNINKVRLFALDKEESFTTAIKDNLEQSGLTWPDYLIGVIDQLRKHGYQTQGFDCVFGGNIPIGAGMSSSAALEGGVLFGLNELLDLGMTREQMAKIAQKVENEFVGLQSGIMDQYASLNGIADHALKLDCRSLAYENYPFKRNDVHIVLCDTGVRRELASSEYNVRREQCESGVEAVKAHKPDVNSLRDVNFDDLSKVKNQIGPEVFKRCKFVLEENNRVIKACDDLVNHDFVTFGQRMFHSHSGLRDDYEVSCKELDSLVDIARDQSGVYGARMMGGGFGGCTINLVEDEHLEAFKEETARIYEKQTGQYPEIYTTQVSAGTHLIDHS